MLHAIRLSALAGALVLAFPVLAAKAPAKPAAKAEPAARVEIELSHQFGHVGEERLQQLVERFNEGQKGVTVKVVRQAEGGKPAVMNLARRQDVLDGADARLGPATETIEQRAFEAVIVEVAGELFTQRLDQAERGERAARLRHRDGTIEGHHRRRLEPLQRAIQKLDLGPVGVLGPRRAGMQRGDGGLELIRTRPTVPHRLVEQRQPLGDHRPVPAAAILVVEQHDGAVGIEPRRGARVLKQHQRRQAHHLGLGREQRRLGAQPVEEPGDLGVGVARGPGPWPC